jgi:hypothetical protein
MATTGISTGTTNRRPSRFAEEAASDGRLCRFCGPMPQQLVGGGHLDVVDDEGLDGAFGGLKFEA